MNWKLTWRIWFLIIAIIISIIAIHPSFQTGAVVKYVSPDSPLYTDGLRAGDIITKVNNLPISSKTDYTNAVSNLSFSPNGTKFEIDTTSSVHISLLNATPDIAVDNVPRTKIQTGLDLRGGARALVQPEGNLTDSQMQDLIQVSKNRFNVYGLADVQISAVSDLAGNKFMLVEIAGATPGDLQSLITQQGKFDAKIGNITVFEGGKKDISDVCRNDATCAGITQCSQQNGGSYACNFQFSVYLNPDAAQKHADITSNISLDSSGQYLSQKLELYVDDKQVDSLLISANLKGRATTQISIQGSGTGQTQETAYADATADMNKLQTILITGSLPYKLDIVKLDTISPTLGDTFVYWIVMAGIGSIVLVGIIVFAKYRKIKDSLAVLVTSFSEIIIILGFAAFINWNLDLPSIAGILATIGTGIDQQIVILDESQRAQHLSLKERMKRALFVVFSAFFTSAVALLPLFSAGAGFFKGFAITTLIGITAGVFITRPAFSDIIKLIEEGRK
jgi:preprotein translocase subunit SecD